MKDRKSFLLRLEPALYESLERWAQQELRSVNGQIEFLLRQAVNQREGGARGRRQTGRSSDRPTNDDGALPGT